MDQRIINHNNHHHGKQSFTAKANDWKLFLFIPTKEYPQANRIEILIKKKKSAKFIQNLKKFPLLIQKLLLEAK